MEVIKPPLGIIPRMIWLEQRYNDLEDAIKRYIIAGRNVPTEWYKELYEIHTEILE